MPIDPRSKAAKWAYPVTRSALLTVFSIMLWQFGSPQTAFADFRLCNDTTSLVGVALGYRESSKWVTEGWWQIPGETCTSLIEGDLNSRFYYLYAEDADKGGQWRGEIFMCTADRAFGTPAFTDLVMSNSCGNPVPVMIT